jgi:hypothetical protein
MFNHKNQKTMEKENKVNVEEIKNKFILPEKRTIEMSFVDCPFTIDIKNYTFCDGECDEETGLKIFRMIYSPIKFKEKVEKFKKCMEEDFPMHYTDDVKKNLEKLLKGFEEATPLTYSEAINIKNNDLLIKIFDYIDPVEMIKGLPKKRLAVEGVETVNKRWDENGNFVGEETIHNIYELYEVVVTDLLPLDRKERVLSGEIEPPKAKAIKCWCTSTKNEHWIWTDDTTTSPLEAVANTFIVHENIIPHIKCLKRQGDVLIVEMKEGYENIKPEGAKRPLTKDEYFKLLTAQA